MVQRLTHPWYSKLVLHSNFTSMVPGELTVMLEKLPEGEVPALESYRVGPYSFLVIFMADLYDDLVLFSC